MSLSVPPVPREAPAVAPALWALYIQYRIQASFSHAALTVARKLHARMSTPLWKRFRNFPAHRLTSRLTTRVTVPRSPEDTGAKRHVPHGKAVSVTYSAAAH